MTALDPSYDNLPGVYFLFGHITVCTFHLMWLSAMYINK